MQGYTARLRVPRPEGVVATDTIFVTDTLEQMRETMEKAGLVRLEQRIDIDPYIIEVWV